VIGGNVIRMCAVRSFAARCASFGPSPQGVDARTRAAWGRSDRLGRELWSIGIQIGCIVETRASGSDFLLASQPQNGIMADAKPEKGIDQDRTCKRSLGWHGEGIASVDVGNSRWWQTTICLVAVNKRLAWVSASRPVA